MSWYAGTGSTSGGSWGNGDSSVRSSWITWCSLVIVAVVVLALLVSRFFYIRRYYKPTFRSYFVPPRGIHINWLRIHIEGPPARLPREPPPSYYQTTGQRRRRRHRQTVGDTLGAGGTRLGERDADDMWDDEQSMAEMGQAGVVRRGNEMLPQYYVDLGLPQYQAGDGTAAEEAERIRAIAAAAGEAEAIPSAAEYEAASRVARAAGAGGGGGEDTAADGTANPTYPPVAHLASSTIPSSSSASATTPVSRPSAPLRSLTARSGNNFLSAALPFLTRAPSYPPPPHSPSRENSPRATALQETLEDDADGRTRPSSASEEPAATRRRPGLGLHRHSSSTSGSSSATKLGDSSDDGTSEIGGRRRKGADDDPLTASSSKVRLEGEEKAEEEKVEEVTKESQVDSAAGAVQR
ncbi:hypothetical protein JCM11251_006696 [Rhodosporidiobolus azoricus]